MKITNNRLTLLVTLFALAFGFQSCEQKQKKETKEVEKEVIVEPEKPEYFLLRPEVEKAYGYSHAVKIGNDIKISVLFLGFLSSFITGILACKLMLKIVANNNLIYFSFYCFILGIISIFII